MFITGSETISGSLFISGATEFGGNLIPKTARGATLGTSERPFSEIFVSSGSINIASDTIGDPNTTLTNIGGNILVSAGGMRLVGDASFIAATGSFGYISGSMTQVGNYTQTGNYLMTGNKTVSGSLEVSGSSKVNGYDVVTNNTNTFNPQFKDVNNTTAGIVTTASYTLMNNLCYFRVYVDFANCTNFGNSQYQITLPFTASHTFTARDGHLHNTALDARYHIAGTHHAPDDGTTLKFYYFASTTDLAWKWNTPVSASSTSSHFDISGMYQIS
jgi:hypothetical protein